MAKVEEELGKLQEKLGALQTQLTGIQGDVTQLTNKATTLEATVTDLKSKLGDLSPEQEAAFAAVEKQVDDLVTTASSINAMTPEENTSPAPATNG